MTTRTSLPPEVEMPHLLARVLRRGAIGIGSLATMTILLGLCCSVLLPEGVFPGAIRTALWLTGGGALAVGLASWLLIGLAPVLWPYAIGVGGSMSGLFATSSGFLALVLAMVLGASAERQAPPEGMAEVDPAGVEWFDEDGKPRLHYADHADGQRRYWNHAGLTTRSDRAVARPVTAPVRSEWEIWKRREAELADLGKALAREREALASVERAREEAESRLETTRAAIEAAESEAAGLASRRGDLERELESLRGTVATAQLEARVAERAAREAEEAARRLSESPRTAAPAVSRPAPASSANLPVVRAEPVVREPEPRGIPLRRGKSMDLPVHGDTVEAWSPGRTLMWADDARYHQPVAAGQRLRFRGHQVIHVVPLEPAAAEVFVRKVEDERDAPSGGGRPGSGSPSSSSPTARLVRW